MNIEETIQFVLTLNNLTDGDRAAFRARLKIGAPYTKHDGSADHVNVFFLPYDKKAGKIFLGHHIKADDWIPPGGHIEPDETPVEAAIREMKEELYTDITAELLEPWNLSVKVINRPEKGCMTHYDIWHLVHINEQSFNYDPREYHDAGWFTILEGLKQITKNPDFAAIIKKLL